MGQENSTIGDDTPPETLTERTLAAVADYINSGEVRRIVCMTGAGISTAAGIPDFRSPDTGLYSNLAKLNLPRPEAVFDLPFFKENPRPFYVLAKDLYPGNFHPTVSHVFISLLAKKGLLHQLFTQNIDCLERVAGVPPELIVEAHGSFANQRCIECKTPFPADRMREHVDRAEVPLCLNEECGGLVKPDIVFFGEALPSLFYDRLGKSDEADLVLVLGTSLSVYPFASLPDSAPTRAPRVLFNMEKVGSFGTRADDVMELGACDDGIRKLADALGWREELEAEWKSIVGEEEATRQMMSMKKRAEDLEDEVTRLAENIERAVHIDDGEDADDLSVASSNSVPSEGQERKDVSSGENSRVKGEVATAAFSSSLAPEVTTSGAPEKGEGEGSQREVSRGPEEDGRLTNDATTNLEKPVTTQEKEAEPVAKETVDGFAGGQDGTDKEKQLEQ